MNKFSNIFASLKYRDFRLYFSGLCVSQVGTWMQQVAMSWLIYEMTGSIVLLGTVVFLAQLPVLLFSPFLSALIDRYNKKSILIITQSVGMTEAFLLAILVFSGTIQIWQILTLSFIVGCINALDLPARQTFYSSLVPRSKLTNAIGLNSSIIQGSQLIGPAIAGFLIKIIGEGGCFLVNGISYLFILFALRKIVYNPQKRMDIAENNIFDDLKKGFSYIKNNSSIGILLLLVAIFCFFAFPVRTFITAYIKDVLLGDSILLGIMMASLGLGAFAAALYLASRNSAKGLEKMLIYGIVLCSLVMIPFFFISKIYLAIPIAVVMGFGLICVVATSNTLLQMLSDNKMKGRVMGYFSMGFIGGSALGNIALTWLSKHITIPYTVCISGVACIVSLLVFKKFIPKIEIEN